MPEGKVWKESRGQTRKLDPVRRERFFADRITRQLSHPNICRVYDIAEFEGLHFLSMEFIDGLPSRSQDSREN
jgi:hypothetical protein